MVLAEFQSLLAPSSYQLQARQVDSAWMPGLRRFPVPRSHIYVLDAHSPRPVVEALVGGILERYPTARLLVLSEEFVEANGLPLLRLGVKGLITYAQAEEQLLRALEAVAAGGYWVPRFLLSHFVDSILGRGRERRPVSGPANLSPRENEVLEGLLNNLSNKEIANKLHISERTAKFHVSNLLSKFGVRRRADLILADLIRRRVPFSHHDVVARNHISRS